MSGYAQQTVAALLVEYREREDRLESHPGKRGLANCAVLLDVDYGLEQLRDKDGNPKDKWDGEFLARAAEWMDGIEFDRYADPKKTPDTAFEPMLVEDIPELQTAIREAHDVDSHLVRWRGKWTSRETLLRMLDDTRAVRRIAGAMSRKTRATPFVIQAGAAHRGTCAVCGAWCEDVLVWRFRPAELRWCLDHGRKPLDLAGLLA